MLNSDLSSALRLCKPAAISLAATGSLVTCRKRNMLSGLKEDGRGLGRIEFLDNRGGEPPGFSLSNSRRILARGILVTFLHFHRNFFCSAGIIEVGQHTTGQPPSVRLAGHPRKGTRGGGTTWPASSFFLSTTISMVYEAIRPNSRRRVLKGSDTRAGAWLAEG